jgi:Ankyrin repeats (3 copies)
MRYSSLHLAVMLFLAVSFVQAQGDNSTFVQGSIEASSHGFTITDDSDHSVVKISNPEILGDKLSHRVVLHGIRTGDGFRIVSAATIDDPHKPYDSALAEIVAERKDAAMVSHLLQLGADPNAKTSDGVPVLCGAMHMSDQALMSLGGGGPNLEIATLLLDHGADPDAVNKTGQTALMAAAFARDEKLVKILLDHKANVNIGSMFGMTALMYARGRPVVKLLVAAGASVKGVDFGAFASPSSGTVTGTVEVVQGQAVLPEMGARLVFSGNGKEYETEAGNDGRYEIFLPAPDVYRVRMALGNCYLSRSAFHIRPGEKLEFRFVGVNCPFIDEGPSNIPLERNKLLPPEVPPLCAFPDELPVWYREERFEADPSTQRPEVVISFGRCEDNPKRVMYFSLAPSKLPGPFPWPAGDISAPVAITTETFTVRADEVMRPGRGFTFYASGNVSVEDGRGHVTNAQSATLRFANGQPVITTQN